MPTFPRSPLSFRTASSPLYGWKAGFPRGAFLGDQRLKPAPGSAPSDIQFASALRVGGEYTSSIVFLVERASVGYRGLMRAVICCGTTLGILLGSGVGATIAALMTTETLDRWG